MTERPPAQRTATLNPGISDLGETIRLDGPNHRAQDERSPGSGTPSVDPALPAQQVTARGQPGQDGISSWSQLTQRPYVRPTTLERAVPSSLASGGARRWLSRSRSVFISYRRHVGGVALALYQHLVAAAVDAFYDLESIRAGRFESVILRQIAARPYFLLVLTPGT